MAWLRTFVQRERSAACQQLMQERVSMEAELERIADTYRFAETAEAERQVLEQEAGGRRVRARTPPVLQRARPSQA